MTVTQAMEEHTREREPFHSVAREHLPRLYGMARRLAGQDAEDLVQDSLVKAYRAFGDLKDEATAGAWLAKILVNCHSDRLRRKSRRVEEVSLDGLEEFSLFRKIAEEDPFPYSDTLHTDFLGAFDAGDVQVVLERLPDLYRVPLVLRYVDDFPTKEIARILGAPLGTVLARLHRGRKLFELALWEYAEESGLLDVEVKR